MRRREGEVRRPQAGFVTLHSGGPGSPSVPTGRDGLQWLGAAWTKAGESLPDRGAKRLPSAPGRYGPGTEIAAMERRGARASR